MVSSNEISILQDKAEDIINTWINEYTSWDDGEYDDDEIEACLSAIRKVRFKVVVEEI